MTHGKVGDPRMRSGLLEITSLNQLKEKLVKVLVVVSIEQVKEKSQMLK